MSANDIIRQFSDQEIEEFVYEYRNLIGGDARLVRKLEKGFLFKDLISRIKGNFDSIRSQSVKTTNMEVRIKPSEETNKLIGQTTFTYKRFYLTPLSYYFLQRKNSIMFKGNSSNRYRYLNFEEDKFMQQDDYKEMLEQENETSAGFIYNHPQGKKSLFIRNTTYFKDNYEMALESKLSRGNQDLKRKETSITNSISLTKNFQERPFIFREKLALDPIDNLNLRFGIKSFKNNMQEESVSRPLLSNTPKQDSLLFLKFSINKNFLDFEKLRIFGFNASSSLMNTLNSTFLKNEIFLRKFTPMGFLLHQLNLELANTLPLSGKGLKVSERNFCYDFTGVEFPGPKSSFDSLGMSSYFLVKNKWFLMDIPLFSSFYLHREGFQLTPFVHFNGLLDLSAYDKPMGDYSRVYLSTGIGINFISEAFSCEFYYNAYIKKNTNDIGSEFSFNFGID